MLKGRRAAQAADRGRAVGAWPAFAAAALLITGCASLQSLDTAPFAQFAAALQPLRDGVDSQALAQADASRAELIRQVKDGEISPADLQLQFDSSDPFATSYGFAEQQPNFARLVRFRQGLKDLNEALIGYAQSLAELAGGGAGGDILPTTAQFGEMATELNANAGAAAAALEVRLDPDDQALLSAAAIEIFKAHIERERREALAEAIAQTQPRVDAFAQAAAQAVRFLASLVETDYQEKILPLATVTPPDPESILALNDATEATLATLKSLADSYLALPAAHRNLAAVAANRGGGLAALVALGNETSRLNELIAQLEAANTAAVPTP